MLQRAQLFPSAITHGFTIRKGGVSQGRHASLNLGSRHDDPEAVAENLRRVAGAGGFAPKELVRVKQVHGDTVLTAHEVGEQSEADALWLHRARRVRGRRGGRGVGACTHASPELYFSFRRDGAGIGQQLGFIGFR